MTLPLLTDAQLSQLKTLFSDALDIPAEKRSEFVLDATSSDPVLRRELASLLDAHVTSGNWFETLQQSVIETALASIDSLPGDSAAPGQQVSHYELIERIAGGGMGVVFKARDTRLGRLVALKFLPRHHASNPSARERLIAEAKAASRLDHPNIGTVYEIGEAQDGRQFIAMAWYDGQTLKSRIRRGPLTSGEVASIGTGVANALAAAHAAGIVHRDVKPANVLLTPSGAPKLVDFGIALLESELGDERSSLAGTLAYMSPEQTRGHSVDSRTDIWSFGVTLYESLTGERPFRGATEEELIASIRSDEPRWPPSVNESLARILRKCLAKEKERRYQRADEIVAALSQLNGRPDHSRSPNVSTRLRSQTFALAILVVAGVASLWWYSRARQNDRRTALVASPVKLAVAGAGADADTIAFSAAAFRQDLREELGTLSTVSVQDAAASAYGARFVLVTAVSTRSPLTVNAKLVDSTMKVRFSKTYRSGEEGSVDIVPAIATDVARAIDLPLSPDERASLSRARTQNAQSYYLYLLGRNEDMRSEPATAVESPNADRLRSAQAYYVRARSADPEFAEVHGRLAATHVTSALTFDTTHTRLEQARLEAETALRIDAHNADARLAMASYWNLSGNRKEAIQELESAIRSNPNSVRFLIGLGELYRSSGRFDEAIALAKRALKVDPRNPDALWFCAMTSGRVRKYNDSFRALTTYLTVRPRDYEVGLIRGQSYLRLTGIADTLWRATENLPPNWDTRGIATYSRYVALRVMRRFSDALAMLDSSRVSLSSDGLVYHPRSLMRAEIYHDMGNDAAAIKFYERARAELTDSSIAHPKNPGILVSLGLAYAGLGRNHDALDAVQRAIDIAPLTRQTPVATSILGSAVDVFARTGQLDRAFQTIELLLTMPAGREMSVPLLKVWPGFDPLRRDPRYAAIVNRF